MVALLDLDSVELENPGRGRGLALPGSRNSAIRHLKGAGVSPLPGYLKDRGVAAGERVGRDPPFPARPLAVRLL